MEHNETIDLCDSDNNEAKTRVLSSGVRKGSANAPLCLEVDSSSSEEEEATNETVRVPQNQETVPSKQEVIELDDSSDDDSVQVVESATRKPAAIMTEPSLDDSDFDSSDDERDLMWHLQGSKRSNSQQNSAKAESAELVAASKPVGEQTKEKKQPAARGKLQNNVQKQRQEEQPNETSDATADCNLNVLPIGQSRNNGMNVKVKEAEPAVAVTKQTLRSPPAKKMFTARPKSASPARRHSSDIPRKRIIGDGSFSHGHVSKKSPDNAIFAGRARPSTLSFAKPANNKAAIRRKSGASVDDVTALTSRAYDSESSSDASLMTSRPVFAKRPMVVSDKAVQQDKTLTSRKLPPLKQGASLPPTRLPDRKLSPRKRQSANKVKQFAASLKRSNDSKVAAPSAQNHLSSGNSFSRQLSGKNMWSASGGSPCKKTVRNKASVKKLAFGAAARVLKRKKGQPMPGEGDLVALGRKNKGRGSSLLNDRIRKAAATTTMKMSVQKTNSPPTTKRARTKVPSPALKRASTLSMLGNKSILKGRNGGDGAGPKNHISGSESHASQTHRVDRTVSPPTVDAPAASSQPPTPALKPHGDTTTPFSTKNLPSSWSSSSGSVVSPTDEICDKLVSVTSSNHQDSFEPQVPSEPNKDESTIESTNESTNFSSISFSNDKNQTDAVSCLSTTGETQSSTAGNRLAAAEPSSAPIAVTASASTQPMSNQPANRLHALGTQSSAVCPPLSSATTAHASAPMPFNPYMLNPYAMMAGNPQMFAAFQASQQQMAAQLAAAHASAVQASVGQATVNAATTLAPQPPPPEAAKKPRAKKAKKESSKKDDVAVHEPASLKQSDVNDSPMVESQASSDFAEASSSDSELSDEGVVAENAKSLQDSLSLIHDEGINLWKRKTKKVDYKEPGDDIEMESSDSPPKKRRKTKTRVSSDQDSANLVRSNKRKRTPSNSPSPDSLCRQESLPDLEDEESEELKECLQLIEHSSKYTYDENGLPTHELSVYSHDGTVFDLLIQVKPSKIPNSGMGAFLTFKGARVLKGNKRREAEKYTISDFDEAIEAKSRDGSDILVKLKGEKLHGDCNIQNLPDTAFVSDPSIKLTSADFSVELGRYGPVLKADRKREPDYDVKNYLFNDAPAEYGFGVSGKFFGCKQIIDITDDATGTRHEAALRLPMNYVNEVGHNPDLDANVFIREQDNLSVHYYLNSRKPLNKGETVELYADYEETYERVRERKGYGKNKEVKSDEHEPAALARNFEEREFITDLIGRLDTLGLFHMTEFVAEKILEPLDGGIDKFLENGSGELTCLQWVARHRLTWLSEIVLSRVSTLLRNIPHVLPRGFPPYRGLLEQTKKWANQMKWPLRGQCVSALATCDADAYKALALATREDILYRQSTKLVSPLDETMWCPVAVQLLSNLCVDTASSMTLNDGDRVKALTKSFLRHAKSAAEKIRAACRDCREDRAAFDALKFMSSVASDEVVDINTLKTFAGFKDKNFFGKHTTVRKGILATMLEVQSYTDALALASLPENVDVKIAPKGSPHEVLIVDGGKVEAGVGVVGYPRLVSSVEEGDRICEDWYLLWQVVYAVHCFAVEFIGTTSETKNKYSLEKLCRDVGVDVTKARIVVERGIDTMDYAVEFVGKSKPSSKRSTYGKPPRQRAPRQTAQRPRGPSYNKKLFDGIVWKALVGLGWTLDVGTRPSDFYFLPPGVTRGRNGFSNRKHYFDSVSLVMKFIKTDERWKDRPEVVAALDLFNRVDELRSKKKLPKNYDVEQVIRQLEQA